ncbi:MAG: nickel pincer cofactor biosynthesis protein LarC [Nitrospirota bacterium]
MKIAYFDCYAGISGDMCLGALVDAGVDIADLKKALKNIPIAGYQLTYRKAVRNGISATKVNVAIKRHAHQRSIRWKDIEKIIKASSLAPHIKQKGTSIFKRLFEAEAKVHGEDFRAVHLHELGGIDCIVDVFGTVIGLDMLGIEKIYASPINLGSGTVQTAHGILPVPAPATAELLKGCPVHSSGIPFELTTPTGAAIIASLTTEFLSTPDMQIEQVGYGAGNKDFTTLSNTLRIMIGEHTGAQYTDAAVTIIEANIDDMNPQLYEAVVEKLLDAGALDVFLENIIMKKGRPAIKLTVMAKAQDVDKLSLLLFSETTTIGLRFYTAQRKTLEREIVKVKTKYGEVRVKRSSLHGTVLTSAPEYDDLKALATKTGIPLKKLAEEIRALIVP